MKGLGTDGLAVRVETPHSGRQVHARGILSTALVGRLAASRAGGLDTLARPARDPLRAPATPLAAMWSRVIGQPRATDTLSQALASGRVGGTYLFHGPARVGPARGGAGLRPGPAVRAARAPRRARGRRVRACLPCTKAARLVHPDLHVYLPFPKVSKGADKDDRPGDYADRLAALAAEPYAPVDYSQRAGLDDDGPSKKQVEHPEAADERAASGAR